MNMEYVCSLEKKFYASHFQASTGLAPDEILVRPKFVGICGSDLFHFLNVKDKELRLGHEWIGEVLEAGTQVANVESGDWITTSATLGCGVCDYCQQKKVNLCENPTHLGSDKHGALSSTLKFKSFNALRLKSKDASEVLIEVMAVAVQATKMIPSQSKKALILGAGTVGVLTAYLLQQQGIDVTLVDRSSFRVSQAQKMKLSSFVLNHFLLMPTKNQFDLLIDASNDRQGPGGWNFLSHFGSKNFHAVIIGKYLNKVSIDSNEIAKQNASINFMRGVPLSTLEETIETWSGKMKFFEQALITHRFPAQELDRAFATALDNTQSIKVAIAL